MNDDIIVPESAKLLSSLIRTYTSNTAERSEKWKWCTDLQLAQCYTENEEHVRREETVRRSLNAMGATEVEGPDHWFSNSRLQAAIVKEQKERSMGEEVEHTGVQPPYVKSSWPETASKTPGLKKGEESFWTALSPLRRFGHPQCLTVRSKGSVEEPTILGTDE